nr:single-strand binding protein [Saccharomycopsis crataegensis]
MIYDKIDNSKLSVGKPNNFKNSSKFLYPIFYEDSDLFFTLKNKFYIIDTVQTNNFNKEFIEIKSKQLDEQINKIAEKFNVSIDDNKKYVINYKTVIKDAELNDLRNNRFKALISISIPTYYEDKKDVKTSLQLYIKEIIVLELISSEIEYEMNKLSLAI